MHLQCNLFVKFSTALLIGPCVSGKLSQITRRLQRRSATDFGNYQTLSINTVIN